MNPETKRLAGSLQLKFWRAEDRMRAAEVPPGDRAEGASPDGPVTVGGYYEVPTKSGRRAWAYYQWTAGQLTELHCTYDRETRRVCDELVAQGADPLWEDDGR